MQHLTSTQLSILADNIDAARRALERWPDREGRLIALALAPVWAGGLSWQQWGSSDVVERYRATPCDLAMIEQIALWAHREGLDRAAIAFWRRALRVSDAFDLVLARPRIHRELGLLLSKVGEVSRAARHFDRAAPGNANFMEQILVGHALIELGEMAAAQRAFERALDVAASPAEAIQAQTFLHPRLLEFEGQVGGLSARDLHYVHSGGLLLLTCAPGESSGYHGELEIEDALVASVLDRMVKVLDQLQHRPTCVVPANNEATSLSLAIAELLRVPHFSHQRSISWDRPLVVTPHMNQDSAQHWHPFLDALPGHATTFAFGHDWTDDTLPVADVTGLLSTRCTFASLDGHAPTVRGARRLLSVMKGYSEAGAGELDSYYLAHGQHRLGWRIARAA